MKNIIFVIGIGLLAVILIFWVWFSQEEDPIPTLAEVMKQQEAQTGIPVNPMSSLGDTKISIDEGLVIDSLFDRPVDIRITSNEVRNVETYQGVLVFEEKEGDNWNLKSIDLETYIDKYLK